MADDGSSRPGGGAALLPFCWVAAIRHQTRKVIVPHFGGERQGDEMMQGCGDLAIPTKAIVKMTVLATD